MSIGNAELTLNDLVVSSSPQSNFVNYQLQNSNLDLVAVFNPLPKTGLYRIYVNLGTETIDYDYPNYSISVLGSNNNWKLLSVGALNKAGHLEFMYLKKGDVIKVTCTRYNNRTTFNGLNIMY